MKVQADQVVANLSMEQLEAVEHAMVVKAASGLVRPLKQTALIALLSSPLRPLAGAGPPEAKRW